MGPLALLVLVAIATQASAAESVHEPNNTFYAFWQLVAAGAALPGTAAVGIAIWRIWTWFFARKDDNSQKNATNTLSYEQQLQAGFLAAGARMDENTKWIIAHLKEYLDSSQKEIEELEVKRVKCEEETARWRELARTWYWSWREQKHELSDARQYTLTLADKMIAAGLLDAEKMPKWDEEKDKIVPSLEDPMPKKE